MNWLLLDTRSAWRAAQRRPIHTILTVLTLVLGIGANAAIFAVARGVLLRPLPYLDPDSLVLIWRAAINSPEQRGIASPQMLREYRARTTSFTDIAAVELWRGTLSAQVDLAHPDGTERLRGSIATLNFFGMLGVNAALGRTFVESDEWGVVVLSDALWRRRFGADPTIVGKTIDLAGGRSRVLERFQVIGVLPARFRFTYPEDTEIWFGRPWQQITGQTQQAVVYHLIARLKPDVSVHAASDDVGSIMTWLQRDLPSGSSRGKIWLEPIHEWSVGRVRPAVRLIVGVTSLLVLIATLNVASLLLAQTASRRREFAIQQSLGASRPRLVRQLLTETGLLTAVSSAVAVAVVATFDWVVRAVLPPSMPRVDEIGIDLANIAWTTAVATATLLLAGLLPSLKGAMVDPQAELMHGGYAASSGRSAVRIRQGLTAFQVGCVSVLMIGGALLLQSLWHLQHADLGFDGTTVLTNVWGLLGPANNDPARIRAFQEDLLQRVRQIPGVREASTSSAIPFRGVDFGSDLPVPHSTERIAARRRHIDPEFFGLMRIPLVAGRFLTASDNDASTPVVVVSQALATALFGTEAAVGRQLQLDKLVTTGLPALVPYPAEIVGVVGDVKSVRIEDGPLPALYLPQSQWPSGVICLVIRADPDAGHVAAAVRAALRAIAPNQPAGPMTTIDDVVSRSIADRRFYAIATTALALVALLLTASGLYGVMVTLTAQRVRELGVRVAFGATRRALIALLLRQGMTPVLVGAVIGGLAAAGTVRFFASYLFGIGSVGPATYAVAFALVTTAGLAACVFPARRASTVDPAQSLRSE